MRLASAARAGVGAAALALAGCGGPDVHNERDRPGSPPTRERQADGEQASIAQSRDEGSAPMTAAACSRPPLGISDIWRFDDSATVPPGDPADPLEWRERYHWRNLPRPEFPPRARGELALVFRLRRGAVWPEAGDAGGRELSADDVRAMHEMYREPEAPQSEAYRAVASIAADDAAGTVAFSLAEPSAPLRKMMLSINPRRPLLRHRRLQPRRFVLDVRGGQPCGFIHRPSVLHQFAQ